MRVFISGGCKNGKSTFAQNLAVLQKPLDKPLYYLATMIPHDDEDRQRIHRHISERSHLSFETIEIGYNINNVLNICDLNGSFLLDSTTALLANEMFANRVVNASASEKICLDIIKLLERIKNIVIVSDAIYSDGQMYDNYTKAYAKGLAAIDRACAEVCDAVLEVCYGSIITYKGDKNWFKAGGLL